jgi:hypothetical protein
MKPNTVTDPRAVMIHLLDAAVTECTMYSSMVRLERATRWSINIASIAKFHFNNM